MLLQAGELVASGLAALRQGRVEAFKAADLGLAQTLIQYAVDCFARAVDLGPDDAKALGNLGNSLLAQGTTRPPPPKSTASSSSSPLSLSLA